MGDYIVNPMMYRVFLQDEKDARCPLKNHSNVFRITINSILAWSHQSGNYIPSLKQ